MSDSDVRQWAGRSYRAGGPAFDLLAWKLRRPLVRPEMVPRPRLIKQLAGADPRPIVSVIAPPGYGKSTLLSQWAERNDLVVAWVSVDEADNDPKVLLSYVAEALDAVEPIGQRVFDALASRVSSVPGSVVPRLGAAFSSMTAPVVLVLDDVHLLHDSECRAALSVLADHVPAGSRLVLAGRAEPPLRIARLRGEGRILEIGPGELSFTEAEAASLLRAAEVVLGDDEVAELHRRTEGWPVGLYLAALYLREGGSLPAAAASFGGDDRFVSEHVESEFLSRISSSQRTFLTRAAALERMSGPLCEAVLERPGAGLVLADLARSNLLLVPLDRQAEWYSYHHQFRDMLLAELDRREPGQIPVLRRRAAAWYLRNDLPEEALEYSMAAGDVDTAAGLVEQLWGPTYRQARITTLQRWFQWLEGRGGIEGRPVVAAYASFVAAVTGRPGDAERWADAVDRWQYQDTGTPRDPFTEAITALLRAYMCRRGVEQMHADADEAARRYAVASRIGPTTRLMQGIARILSGDLDGADPILEEAVRFGAESGGPPDVLAEAVCERALLAIARGDWSKAEALAAQARAFLRPARVENITVCAVQARVALHRGNVTAAREELVSAQRLRPLLTYAQPPLAVQTRIELIRVHLALGDLGGARTLMQEIDEVLQRRPGLGTLVGAAEGVRAQLAKERGSTVPGASALTATELRLLPLLSTHLSAAEIAAELVLSRHTIKSRIKSLYRKLDASTRNEAVTRARELGLLEGYAPGLPPTRG